MLPYASSTVTTGAVPSAAPDLAEDEPATESEAGAPWVS